jgi:Zn-dependent M32 family carboxypeptidase
MRAAALASCLLFLAASRSFAVDCDACLPERMCNRHDKETEEVIKATAKDRKNKDPMKRREALDKLGKLNNSHLNSRSKEVAVLIADMLDDVDPGIRMGAVEYMGSNQEVTTAKAALGKVLDKFISKVSKPRPSGKSVSASNLGVEWDNSLDLVKACLPAMQQMGGPDAADYFISAIKSPNMVLAAFAAPRSVTIKSERLVEVCLSRVEDLATAKDEDEKLVCEECAKAFSGQTGFVEEMGENRSAWIKKARLWWQEKKDEYNPPKEENKEGEEGK